MTEPSSPDDPSSSEALSDEAARARLDALRDRLDARPPRPSDERPTPDSSSARTGIAQALRLSSEFIAGVVVGAAIGYSIDWIFGTSPWGLIVFFLLGFCAAILNVMRAAGLIAPSKLRMESAKGDDAPPPR